MFKRHVYLTSAMLLVAHALIAQDSRGRLQGRITDATDAVIVGASVSLLNDATGISVVQQSNQTGQYLFDFVQPGTYTVTVEMSGFSKFVQKNILVQARADVTVDARLQTGNTRESITVEAAPVAVNFNTSTMGLTIDTKMTNSLPVISRNPYLLVALNPAVVVRSTNEQSPFHHWAANEFDVGGGTNRKNDLILDGAPSMTSQKSSYTPPMDAVQEVNLQQNAVDAEFGHSAGGVISMQMKSGTNEHHGTAYYLGRNPAFNALADRITRGKNLTRQHTWGFTSGNPILKNKLFNFFSYEGWRTIEPRSILNTLPTDLERSGNFSQTLNTAGGLRTIYDPFTTQTSGSVVTRAPFPNNTIPQSRFDATSAKMLPDIWKPNGPGSGPTGVNNFLAGYANRFRYWNFSNRTDWNISDKWKVFGRYNQFETFTKWDDYTGGAAAQPVDGSKRHAKSISGDAVYTLNPTTVLNFRGAYNGITDSFGVPEATLTEADLDKYWPGNAWYKPYLTDLPDIYYPGVTIRAPSTTTLGKTGYWFQEPKSWNFSSKMSKNQGRHYYKVGGEYRREDTTASRPRPMSFDFGPALTANTYNAPNTNLSGDAWASFLLGVMEGNSTISSIPIQRPQSDFVGLFFHDDFKLNQKLTFNIGLRYEFFTALRDPQDRLSRFLDLTNPIPEFQGANAPVLPPAATALRPAAPIYNGAWVFTDSDNRGSWNARKAIFMPRIGMAWRMNDRSALRVGWARYVVPSTLTQGLDILGSVPYPGFDATTTSIAPLQGVPQQRFNSPFPNGLVPVTGKSYDRYTNLGGATTWYQQNQTPGVNDRINVSFQRQLPWRVLGDITYFTNIGRMLPYNYDVNQVDPRIGYQIGNAITTPVPNPFYNLLPQNKMPGQLRTQQTVALREMLRPYPQYSGLSETLRGGIGNRYHSLQMQFQRPFANGFNMVVGYNYNRERNEEFYDEQDNFLHNLTWQPATNARHRITGAAIYQIPVGKGRRFLGNSNRLVDAFVGGWSISTLFTYNSGLYLRFGGLVASGDPGVDEPTSNRWFNQDVFAILPAFTRRSNPLQYDNVKGPRYVNFDNTIYKDFAITERIRFELRGEAYNLANSITWASPTTNRTDANFGKLVSQAAGRYGRQIQYSGRIIW